MLEMRAALDGHSGIPQETRLLFRGLARLDNIEVLGLLQSGNLVIDPGLPLRDGLPDLRGDASQHIARLSQVVVSLQQGAASHRFEHLRKKWLKAVGPLSAAIGSAFGAKVSITGFDPAHFKDFVWRAMFAKTLPSEDFELVTSRGYRVMRWPWSVVNAVGVASGTLGHALYPRLDTKGIDVLIAETPYPGRVSDSTRMVVRYHDAFPLLMPHTVKHRGYHRAQHFHALSRNVADGAWFACVSEATRQDLISVLPQAEARAVTIPNMISHHFEAETAPSDRVPEVIWSRRNRRAPYEGGAEVDPDHIGEAGLPYLLIVSTVEPRKNHVALLDAWELLRSSGFPTLNLVCVGSLGWDHESIMQRFSPWLRRGGMHFLENVPTTDLRLLYRHAQATICPSFGEGFDFSGVEAMRSGGVVAASDIRVHREVYGAASEYFNAYSPQEMAHTIGRLIAPESHGRRQALRDEGARVSAQYLPERVMPMWLEFLRRVAAP